jgi:hypothetical protein
MNSQPTPPQYTRLATFDVALNETEIQKARGASFDVAPSETEIQEARGASRGNAFRDQIT